MATNPVVRARIKVLAKDVASLTRFVEDAKIMLASRCKCVELSFANVMCGCGSIVASIEMRTPSEGLVTSIGGAVSIELVIVGSDYESMVGMVADLREVAKKYGLGLALVLE